MWFRNAVNVGLKLKDVDCIHGYFQVLLIKGIQNENNYHIQGDYLYLNLPVVLFK